MTIDTQHMTYAQRALLRIHQRIISGTMNRIENYGALTPVQRLELARRGRG